MRIKHDKTTDTLTIQLSPRDAQDASNAIKLHIPHISSEINALVLQAVEMGEDVILVSEAHIAAYDVYVKYAKKEREKK